MENTWWPYLVVSENKRSRNTARAAYIDGSRAQYVLSVSSEHHKNIWSIEYWQDAVFIFEYPEDKYNRFIMATKSLYRKGYKIEVFDGKPIGLKLPFIRFSREEKSQWLNGWGISKWAEPLFPEDVAEQFEFVENKFGVPQISSEK